MGERSGLSLADLRPPLKTCCLLRGRWPLGIRGRRDGDADQGTALTALVAKIVVQLPVCHVARRT